MICGQTTKGAFEMTYTTVIRTSGNQFSGTSTNAYKSALEAKKQMLLHLQKAPKKVHISMALSLGDTEIFRSHGMAMTSVFWNFKQKLSEMKRSKV
jgi:hypothetical protein